MSMRLFLVLLMGAVILVRFMLLRSSHKAKAARLETDAVATVHYPRDWPDERILAPQPSQAVPTTLILQLAGVPGSVLSEELGRVRFRGVGFMSELSPRQVAAEFSRQALAAGYRPCRKLSRSMLGYLGEEDHIAYYLGQDSANGPYTIWCTQR